MSLWDMTKLAWQLGTAGAVVQSSYQKSTWKTHIWLECAEVDLFGAEAAAEAAPVVEEAVKEVGSQAA
jgi:hypothetical protein